MFANISKKKLIITGLIGLVSVSAAVLYYQYNKLMSYTIKFKNFVVRQISQNLVVVDLYLVFTNNSKLNFDITNQKYTIYVNNKQAVVASNKKTTKIIPGANNVSVRASFNPSKILSDAGGLQGLLNIASNAKTTSIKFDIKLDVTLWGIIPVSIPIAVNTTLGELLAKPPENP